jgi:hypothetical protein
MALVEWQQNLSLRVFMLLCYIATVIVTFYTSCYKRVLDK